MDPSTFACKVGGHVAGSSRRRRLLTSQPAQNTKNNASDLLVNDRGKQCSAMQEKVDGSPNGSAHLQSTVPAHSSIALQTTTSAYPDADPGGILATATTSATAILPWRGHHWQVRRSSTADSTDCGSTPKVVRFQSSLLDAHQKHDVPADSSEWTLGLVVHSYVRSDSRQLTHVLILNNGAEVHVGSGDVESIDIMHQCADMEEAVTVVDASPLQLSNGHLSSIDRARGSEASEGTFSSDFTPAECADGDNAEGAAGESWMSWYDFASGSAPGTVEKQCASDGNCQDANVDVNFR